jgi:hypothetical protein
MQRIRSRLTYANVMATIAVFLVLGGGSAVALSGSNTVFSDDIVNGEVKSPDLDASSVGSGKIIDNSVKGTDIDESTLSTVPSAQLGGIGRWESKSGEGCDVGADYYTCAFTTINLPRATRVLLIGTAKVQTGTTVSASGHCLLATHLANISDSTTGFDIGYQRAEHIALVANAAMGPGQVDLAIRCRQVAGDAVIYDAAIAAVALSPY